MEDSSNHASLVGDDPPSSPGPGLEDDARDDVSLRDEHRGYDNQTSTNLSPEIRSVEQATSSVHSGAAASCSTKNTRHQEAKYKRGATEHNAQTFVDICDVIYKEVEKIHSTREDCVSTELWQTVEQTKCILDGKEICISVLGLHNTGKSTFLNALIGDYFLPVNGLNETSVKVKVQHDNYIHMGVCPKDCPEKMKSNCCPQLIVSTCDQKPPTIIVGPHNIYDYLQQLNRSIRKNRSKLPPGSYSITLKVNIPLLSGIVPSGWTVSIIDNPGFGEAKKQITQLAEAFMLSSSAYIYLMQTENIAGEEAGKFFKELEEKDKSALFDGRLTIGITKFDLNYRSSSSNKVGAVTVHMVKEDVAEAIKEAVDMGDILVSDDMIIPLCGEWALASSRLASCLINDPREDIKSIREEAARVLCDCPELSLPSGQGQNPLQDIMKSYPSIKIIQEIETQSGISEFKTRIGCVGKACVKV